MGDLQRVQKKKKKKRKHLNGVICTFHSLPRVLQRSYILGIDLSPGFGAEQAAHCQSRLSLYQQGNCQEIERQTGLKINPTLEYTPFFFFSVPLFISSAVSRGRLCCIRRRRCVCVCTFTPADTVRCRCEHLPPPHTGHLKDARTHADLRIARTSWLHKQTRGAMWPSRTSSGRRRQRHSEIHTQTHT